MIVAGTYVIHVECDEPDHGISIPKRTEFTGPNERGALAQARDAGWFCGVHRFACPSCLRRERQSIESSHSQSTESK